MRHPTSLPFTGELKAWAETFFGRSLTGIRLVLDPNLPQQGLRAWAKGTEIHLDPALVPFRGREHLEVLGHELTHLIQQWEGRTPNSEDLLWDPALEAEAEAWGHRFANGGSLTYQPMGTLSRAVAQPLVWVSESALADIGSLDPSTQKVLDLIQGGKSWLSWAIQDPIGVYAFPDQVNLTIGIQQGLHGKELLLLNEPGLLVHPAALMSLDREKLDALCALNTTEEPNSAAQIEINTGLSAQGLLTFDQLAMVPLFLEQVGLLSNPLFQNLTLGNQSSIYRALQGAQNPSALTPLFQKESANFALGYSASVLEFSDYYLYYMSLLNRPGFRAATKTVRERAARELLEQLTLSICNDLQCPVYPGLPTPQQLQQFLADWVTQGNQVGFSRISRGVYLLSLRDEIVHAPTQHEIDKLVRAWLNLAQTLISTYPASAQAVAQNGAAVYFQIEFEDRFAILDLDTSLGCLTLSNFNPGPTPLVDPNAKTTFPD